MIEYENIFHIDIENDGYKNFGNSGKSYAIEP